MVRSKAVRYAVLAVAEVARRQGEVCGLPAREFADMLNLPRAYTAKVMTQLTRAGILRSAKGPGGGYRLGREAVDINFLEVIEAVEGMLNSDLTIQLLDGCEHVQAGMNELFEQVDRQMRDYLRVSTLADFIRRVKLAEFTSSDQSRGRAASFG